jgi:hypothetical protein
MPDEPKQSAQPLLLVASALLATSVLAFLQGFADPVCRPLLRASLFCFATSIPLLSAYVYADAMRRHRSLSFSALVGISGFVGAALAIVGLSFSIATQGELIICGFVVASILAIIVYYCSATKSD